MPQSDVFPTWLLSVFRSRMVSAGARKEAARQGSSNMLSTVRQEMQTRSKRGEYISERSGIIKDEGE